MTEGGVLLISLYLCHFVVVEIHKKKLPEGGRAEEVSKVAKVFFERCKLGSEAVCPVFSLAMMMLIQGGKYIEFFQTEKNVQIVNFLTTTKITINKHHPPS